MDMAIVARYGTPRPGFVEESVGTFKASFALFETLKREGKITSYEAYGLGTGDTELLMGFVILKGPDESIQTLPRDPRVIELTSKAVLTTSHFSLDFAIYGEALMAHADLTEKIAKQLHLVPA